MMPFSWGSRSSSETNRLTRDYFEFEIIETLTVKKESGVCDDFSNG